MTKFSEMSINQLEEHLSTITDPTSASPAEAVLQSKSIRFLSSEIAILKEALCLESKKIQDSNNKLRESQNKYQNAIIVLTIVLAIAAIVQTFF